jgi:hypothetical protein
MLPTGRPPPAQRGKIPHVPRKDPTMQISSVSPDYTSSAHAAQSAPPPPPPGPGPSTATQQAASPAVPPHHKDKDGDTDGSATTSSDGATGQQVNVLA